MFGWIIQSRARTAWAILFFVGMFVFSVLSFTFAQHQSAAPPQAPRPTQKPISPAEPEMTLEAPPPIPSPDVGTKGKSEEVESKRARSAPDSRRPPTAESGDSGVTIDARGYSSTIADATSRKSSPQAGLIKSTKRGAPQGDTSPQPRPAPVAFLLYVPAVTGVASIIGTISTIFFAWRTDRRTAQESGLKLVQMQQQIAELGLKLRAAGEQKNEESMSSGQG